MHPVPVSQPLWIVLARSQALAVQSEGAFDVTVGPYVRLWRRARRSKEMPSPERLAEARAAVGFQHLKLDEQQHTAQLMKPNMRLDLGGIAMGYAVDETLKLLRDRGITRAWSTPVETSASATRHRANRDGRSASSLYPPMPRWECPAVRAVKSCWSTPRSPRPATPDNMSTSRENATRTSSIRTRASASPIAAA